MEERGMGDKKKRLEKGLEKGEKKVKGKLEGLKEKVGEKKDDWVDFDGMGMEEMFVDEWEYFKNVMLERGERRVGGIGNREG